MIRSFIAIDLPEAVLDKIFGVSAYFQTQTPPKALRWVAPENLHLTLKFLGDVPEDKLDTIKSLISTTASRYSPFNITIQASGMFPNAQKPRVVWLGVDADPVIGDLHAALEEAMATAGISPEKRPFSPHLTIARVSRRADQDTVKDIGRTLSKFKVDSLGEFMVDRIHLYQSDLTPKGPIYTELLSAPLNTV
jgi:2'-5' RNA ligase